MEELFNMQFLMNLVLCFICYGLGIWAESSANEKRELEDPCMKQCIIESKKLEIEDLLED